MDHCFLSFSIGYFIGLLYFIDDVDNTLGHNCQWTDNIRTELFDILTRLGPQKMEVNIKQHLNRWKTEKVRFAVAGEVPLGNLLLLTNLEVSKRDLETKQRKFQNIDTH